MRLLLPLFTCFPFFLTAQPPSRLHQEIEKLILFETDIDFDKTPGILIGIVVGDSSWVIPFGSRSRHTMVPPDGHSLFELGGLSQVFTAALVGQMVAHGYIHPDDAVNSFLPENQRNASAPGLTILHLLTHTSGLPRLPFGIGEKEIDGRQPYAGYSENDLMAFFKNFSFGDAKPGEYQFSHLNYALLQVVAERATGKDLQSLLSEKIARPTGMADIFLTLPGQPAPQLAPGYGKTGAPAPPWQFQVFGGALGVKSSLHDLLLFLKSQINPPPGFEPPVLGSGGRGIFPTGMRKDTWIACGWHVIRKRRQPDIVAHTGATAGHRAAMAFTPETGVGVVILSNSPFGLDGLEFLVLNLVNQAVTKK